MIQVLGDRVLIALPPTPDELTTASGLVLVRDPDRAQTPTQGIVVAVGEKSGTVDVDDVLDVLRDPESGFIREGRVINCSFIYVEAALHGMRPSSFDVQIGDCVLFSPASGEEIEDDGIRYVILRESEIIGIVEPKESAA